METCIFEYDDDLDMTFTECGCDHDGNATKTFQYCPNCGKRTIIGIVDLGQISD